MAPQQNPPPPVRSTAAILLTALVLALTPTSCSNDNNSADNPPPTTTPTPESEVKAAYLAYWEMADRLAGHPDPDDPELPTLAGGEALAHLRDGLADLREQGRKVEVGSKTSHRVSDVEVLDTGTARLKDCDVDDSRLLGADGEVLDEGLTTTHWNVTLVRSEDSWRVDRFVRLNAWEGEVDCL